MFKRWRRKKNEEKIVNLATATAFNDEIERFSGINFSDETTDFNLTHPNVVEGLKNKDSNNIDNLVQNARHQINKYKEENNVNEHENLLIRLEQLKNLRDSSQMQPNEFQQMLNRIKERNFNDRMAYIMNRIKLSHRDDDKLELDHNGESLAAYSKGEPNNKITITGDKKQISSLKQKLPKTAFNNNSHEKDDFTITLSVKQFQKVVRDTVEDVLVELGIKNKDE